eukprot:TRINITY_DN76359_c0_g1_i1.p1 TRINITY_DN76359_c0_g1~~TRINITY_DN76359_c0_g1_i1.p1  ORF type:complete len:496 (+),score=57.94 TRINITY_DN76359_c0_g1_i1:254-1741(+)
MLLTRCSSYCSWLCILLLTMFSNCDQLSSEPAAWSGSSSVGIIPMEHQGMFLLPMMSSISHRASKKTSRRHRIGKIDWVTALNSDTYKCCFVLFLGGILSSAGGIGGGGIYVTVLMVFGKLPVQDAIPVSKAVVFFGSIASFILNAKKTLGHDSSREGQSPLIDYNICYVVVPAALLGTYFGVFLNGVLPGSVLLALLTLTLFLMSVGVLQFAIKQYFEDDAINGDAGLTVKSTSAPCDTKKQEAPQGLHEKECSSTECSERSGSALETCITNEVASMSEVSVAGLLLFIVVLCGTVGFHARSCRLAQTQTIHVEPEECQEPIILLTRKLRVDVHVTEMLSFACPLVSAIVCMILAGNRCVTRAKWKLSKVMLFDVMAVCTGCLAGLVGVGGGIIFSPFFLLVGVSPVVAVATSSTCVIFTSSSTTLQYFFTERLIMSFVLMYGVTCLFASYSGTAFVHFLQDGLRMRRWTVTSIVWLGVAISTVLAGWMTLTSV